MHCVFIFLVSGEKLLLYFSTVICFQLNCIKLFLTAKLGKKKKTALAVCLMLRTFLKEVMCDVGDSRL